MLRRWIALVCCGLILFPAESSAAQGGESPALTPHPCDVVPPGEIDGSTIWCAALDVSLDRADRADPGGPQVTLAVAVLRSSAASPALDPVLFLGGDAGLSVLAPDSLADLAARVAPFRAQRHVILFDARGAGLSMPRFECTPGFATDLEACLADLAARGLKPEQFTASALASDAAALMQALDYPAYNLYGLSYGAQVALALLAEPASADRVRSIVLDAALPLPISTLTPYHAAFELARYGVFRSAFALCDADPDCSGAYPYMRERFVTL
uniref:alpha/beta fold hydrolase n=1 Tax=Aggregatilinea sp. TaxID=2806333 RepID=UPI002C11B4C0